MHFMLIYDVGPDFIERRTQLRDEHLTLAWKAADAGELLLAGALEEPTEQAFLLFKGPTSKGAERFAEADPYVRHGLVKRWCVKQWHTVVGEFAASPVRPESKSNDSHNVISCAGEDDLVIHTGYGDGDTSRDLNAISRAQAMEGLNPP